MIKRILHCADIHIKNKLTTHTEMKYVIDNFILKAKEQNPDHIVIVGDLFHDFIEINNEAKILAGFLLNELSKICKVIITQGNHDIRKSSMNRVDSVSTIFNLINNNNIDYLNTTAFYEYDNIVYAVWHHSDKESPWVKHNDYVKKENKSYINLFHDPINGCLSETNQILESRNNINISDFNGDYLFLGDIHLYQEFYKKDKIFGIYPSSLYETKFSEGDGNFHGFIMWDIVNGTFEKHRVDNIYSHHNLSIDSNFDYDDILFLINEDAVSANPRFKIKWYDYSVNMTKVNENKIKQYLKTNYQNATVIFDKKPLMNNKNKDNNHIKNINNTVTHNEIFVSYLKQKSISDEMILDVINIDDIVNKLLINSNNTTNNIKIEKIIFNNFRSYGDNNVVDFADTNGIYQIYGNNAVGKSTILYFIMYMFYGKTPSTIKKDKFNDNKFINNRNDIDFCEGKMYFSVNDERFLIDKKTERKWNKNKTEITACPTTILYYRIDEYGNPINETDEQKSKTQKVIEEHIGTYDDFIRKVHTDSDSLNSLLSNDKASFIDNILYDTGLDIFDKKLELYKSYKKELYKKTDRINIDLHEYENKLLSLNETNTNLLLQKDEKNELIKTLNQRILKGNEFRDSELTKIKDVKVFENINTVIDEIEKYKTLIDGLNTKYNSFNNSVIDELKNELVVKQSDSEYVKKQIDDNRKNIEFINNDVNNINKDINKIQAQIDSETNSIKNTNSLISMELNNIESNIKNELIVLKNKITSIDNTISTNNNLIDSININISNEIFVIDKEVSRIVNDIAELENNKTCPTCQRLYGNDEIAIIESKINNLKLKKESLILSKENNENVKNFKLEIVKITNDNLNSTAERQSVIDEGTLLKTRYTEFVNNKSTYRNDLINKLNTDINNSENNKQILENEIGVFTNQLLEKRKDLNIQEDSIKKYNQKLIDLEKEIFNINDNIKKQDELASLNEKIPLQIEIYNLKKISNESIVNEYNLSKEIIEHNDTIYKTISNVDEKLKSFKNEKEILYNQILNLDIDISKNINIIENTNNSIEMFKKQEYITTVHNLYMDCIHRDGIPTLLLKNMLPIINYEIKELLSNVDFSLWFDEEINLKMCDNEFGNGMLKSMSVLDGSGMERSFISFVLKICFMKISNKSRFNILLLDEVTSKLDIDNVDKFKELLSKTKSIIDNIIIIDHYNDFNADVAINVATNEKGISSLIIS